MHSDTEVHTQLLYPDDDHRTTFEAHVTAVDPEARTLVLDATAFYPTGGHQHCDQGRIAFDRRNFVVVVDVQRLESGTVVHHWAGAEGTLRVGDRVTGTVHRARRLHHMQLHTAQHALSRFAADRFGTTTGRADFAPQGGMAVLEPPLSWTEALLLEDDVNRLIRENRPVSRRIDDGRMLIKIDGLDESPCAGTHVTATGEIGLFKITALEGKVLRYEVGTAAERFAVRAAGVAQEVARRLGVESLRELPGALEELLAERDQAQQRLEHWKAETTTRSVAAARRTVRALEDGAEVFRVDLTHLGAAAAREFLKENLADENEVWVALTERGNLMVSSGTEHVDAQNVLRAFARDWGIRGGGNARFAQGGPVPHDVATPLEQVVERILRDHAKVLS